MSGTPRTVTIDRSLCAGHGRCYSLLPDVFEPDEAGNGHVRAVLPLDVSDSDLEDAILSCPEEAIAFASPTPRETSNE